MNHFDPFLLAPPEPRTATLSLIDSSFPGWSLNAEFTAIDLVECLYARDLAEKLDQDAQGAVDFPPVGGQPVTVGKSLAETACILSRMAVIGVSRQRLSPVQWIALAKCRPGAFAMAMDAARKLNQRPSRGKARASSTRLKKGSPNGAFRLGSHIIP